MTRHITGNVAIDARTVYDDVILDDATVAIAPAASLIFSGDDSVLGDSFAGGFVKNLGALTLSGAYSALQGAIAWINAGTLVQDDSYVDSGAGASIFIRNNLGATWALAGGGGFDATDAASAQFVNLGRLHQIGSSADDSSGVGGAFYNRGGVVEAEGRLSLGVARFVSGGSLEGSGAISISQAVLIDTTVSVASLTAPLARIVGDLTISSQTVDFGMEARGENSGDLNLAGATLTLTNAAADVLLSHVFGAGEIVLDGADDFVDARNLTLQRSVDLVNEGVATFYGYGLGSIVPEATITAAPAPDEFITIRNAQGATWIDSGVVTFTTDAYARSAFVNDGVFQTGLNGDATTFDIAVVNDGVMRGRTPHVVHPLDAFGSTTFDRALGGSGSVEVGFGAVVVNAGVAIGQTFDFAAVPAGVTPTLILNDLAGFSGGVAGFDQAGASGDRLVIGGGWTFEGASPGPYSGLSEYLNFSKDGVTAAVYLAGAYQGAAFFHAAVSGDETTITYSPPLGA